MTQPYPAWLEQRCKRVAPRDGDCNLRPDVPLYWRPNARSINLDRHDSGPVDARRAPHRKAARGDGEFAWHRYDIAQLRRDWELLKFALGRKALHPHHSQFQPRDDRGRWTDDGHTSRVADAAPSKVQLAAMSWDERRRLLFGQRDLFRGEGGGGSAPSLPPFKKGGPTSGVLQTPGRADIELVSGKEGPASLMPAGSRGFDAYTLTHVEGHAVATMRQLGISNGTLYINNPNGICLSCTRRLPSMLPAGAKLNIILPNGTTITFFGVGP